MGPSSSSEGFAHRRERAILPRADFFPGRAAPRPRATRAWDREKLQNSVSPEFRATSGKAGGKGRPGPVSPLHAARGGRARGRLARKGLSARAGTLRRAGLGGTCAAMLRLLRARDAIVQDCAAAARRSREQGGGAEDEAAAVGRTVGHLLDWDEESGAAQERRSAAMRSTSRWACWLGMRPTKRCSAQPHCSGRSAR